MRDIRVCGRRPSSSNLLVMEVTADVVTAKAWYPVRDIREVEMPPVDED